MQQKDTERQALAQKIERFQNKFGKSEHYDTWAKQAVATYIRKISGPELHQIINFVIKDKEE